MEHAKRIGMLVGACASLVSNSWCQEDLIKKTNEKEHDVEIEIEKSHQHECSGKSMVLRATIDKEREINQIYR